MQNLKTIFALSVLVVLVFACGSNNKSSSPKSSDSPPQKIEPQKESTISNQQSSNEDQNSSSEITNSISDVMPDKQKKLIELCKIYAEKHKNEEWDQFHPSTLRSDRKKDLKKLLPSLKIENWVGTVRTTGVDIYDKAWLAINIPGSSIIIELYGGSFMDGPGVNAHIKRSSPLFEQIAALKHGEQIFFSGSFVKDPDNLDYIAEGSATESGSMAEPEFGIKLTSITKY